MRRNTIVAGFGRKGTGKSVLLYDLFTSKAPRVLSLDSTGETRERNADAVLCVGYSSLRDAFRRAQNYQRWHIAAALEPDDVARLFALLTPPLGSGSSLSLAFGGMAIECAEVDLIAPNSGAAPEVLSALRRGRHYALDMYFATQRPASCAVDVRSMSDFLFSFALSSPRDVAAVDAEMPLSVSDRIVRLRPYHCLFYSKEKGSVVELDPARRVVERINLSGNQPGQRSGKPLTDKHLQAAEIETAENVAIAPVEEPCHIDTATSDVSP